MPVSTCRRLLSNVCLQDALAAIDLDDLHDPQASADIVLEMQGRQRYFEGRMSGSASAEDAARKVMRPTHSPHTQSLIQSTEPRLERHDIRNQG